MGTGASSARYKEATNAIIQSQQEKIHDFQHIHRDHAYRIGELTKQMMRLQEELYSVRDALEGDGIIRYPKRDASLESDETSRRSISSKDNEEAEDAQLSNKERVLEGEEKQTNPIVNKADVMNDLMKDLIEMDDPTLSMDTTEIIDPIPVEQKALIQDLDNNINNTSHDDL